MEIKKITQKKSNEIISGREPLGLFYHKGSNGHFIGIDNSTGDAWTVEFHSLQACIVWLKGESEQRCHVCGCTELNACAGGYYWICGDLCSECAK